MRVELIEIEEAVLVRVRALEVLLDVSAHPRYFAVLDGVDFTIFVDINPREA